MRDPGTAGGPHDGIERRDEAARGPYPFDLIAVARVDVWFPVGDDDHAHAGQSLFEERDETIARPFGGIKALCLRWKPFVDRLPESSSKPRMRRHSVAKGARVGPAVIQPSYGKSGQLCPRLCPYLGQTPIRAESECCADRRTDSALEGP